MNKAENKVVIFPAKDNLKGLTREEFLIRLKETVEARVEECYIFGSFANGKFSSNSDVDIILIQKTDVPFLDRGKEFLDLYEIGPPLDLLIYTPEEFKALLKENQGFWKSVKESLTKVF